MKLKFNKKKFNKWCKENIIDENIKNNKDIIKFAEKFVLLAEKNNWTWGLLCKKITKKDVIKSIIAKIEILCSKNEINISSGRITIFKKFIGYDKKHIYFEIIVDFS